MLCQASRPASPIVVEVDIGVGGRGRGRDIAKEGVVADVGQDQRWGWVGSGAGARHDMGWGGFCTRHGGVVARYGVGNQCRVEKCESQARYIPGKVDGGGQREWVGGR